MHPQTELLSLLSCPEKYNDCRAQVRPKMLGYKAERAVQLGPFMRIEFEDELTLSYQVQEILRVDGLQTPESFVDEWLSYKALHPQPGLVTATLMIELQSQALVKTYLWQLNKAARGLYLQAGQERCHAQVNTDLVDGDYMPCGVHFLAFRPSLNFLAELDTGESLLLHCSDPQFRVQVQLQETLRQCFRGESLSRLCRPLKRFP